MQLRKLVVAIDPTSLTSPLPIFHQFQSLLPNFQITTWDDAIFMPQSVLNGNYSNLPNYLHGPNTQWFVGDKNATHVQEKKVLINLLRYHQAQFVGNCLRYLYNTYYTTTNSGKLLRIVVNNNNHLHHQSVGWHILIPMNILY